MMFFERQGERSWHVEFHAVPRQGDEAWGGRFEAVHISFQQTYFSFLCRVINPAEFLLLFTQVLIRAETVLDNYYAEVLLKAT